MSKRIFLSFLKDIAGYAAVFYLSVGAVILYYKITVQGADILYPAVIVSTIFLVYLLIRWIRYYSFNKNINDLTSLQGDSLLGRTEQQKIFSDALQNLQNRYLKEISRIHSETSSQRYFISQWLHNMKTPVSIINLALQRIEREPKTASEAQREKSGFVKEIREENDKLHNGLEQLLNILRMEQFARDYEPEPVDLIKSLTEIINFKKTLFIYNNVFPQLEYDGAGIQVLTDEKWNRFMLEQIINNAVKYSAAGEQKKHIRFIVERETDRVRLRIADQGVGIPQSDINRVFEPFFTGENGRKFRDATGIGLYICSLIAKKLRHRLELDSEKGKGTTVTVTYFLNQ